MVQPLWIALWIYLKDIKDGTAIWPSDPTFGNISKETQNTNLIEHKPPMFIAAIYTITMMWKKLKCPSVDEWIKQLWVTWINNHVILLSHKKEEKFTLCDILDGPGERYVK